MPAPVVAAAGAAAKKVAGALAKKHGLRVFRTFWKWMAVATLIVVVGPVGLVMVTYLALAKSLVGGVPIITAQAQAPTVHGTLACPVAGATVTQGFGPTSNAIEPANFGYPHFHSGVDLAAPIGTPVYAASAGFVAVAGAEVDALGIPIGYGNYVEVATGSGEEEIYGHLSQIAVSPNQVITTGTLIGLVGSTGNSTGPHLHFEFRLHGKPVDPTAALKC